MGRRSHDLRPASAGGHHHLPSRARSVPLSPLAAEDLAEYIGARFERSGRDAGDALRPLLEAARGHPQRAMLLAHFLWERTGRGEHADEGTFADALSPDPREATTLARSMGFGALLFNIQSPQLSISELSQTGRRELRAAGKWRAVTWS